MREFDNWLAMLGGNPPEACAQMGRCSMQNIIEANGDVFPCDFYVLDQYRTGNVRDEDFRFFRGGSFHYKISCRGKREGQSLSFLSVVSSVQRRMPERLYPRGRNYFCRAYQDFFQYAIERLEKLAAITFGFLKSKRIQERYVKEYLKFWTVSGRVIIEHK